MNPIQSFSSFKTANDSAKEVAMEENRKKEYGEVFSTLLKEYGVTSPSELDETKKAEFFKKIEEVINSKDNPNPEGFPPPGGLSDDVPTPDEEEDDEADTEDDEVEEALTGHAKKMKEDGVSDEEIKKMHPEVSDEDLKEENSIDEAEVNSDEEFMEYTMTVLKKAFGEDFDEAKAKETAEGILAKADGDYGAAIGMLTSGLGEAEEVSEERAAEIEKEILDMGKPEELKTGDDLVTQDQDVTVEPKGEADDTADGTEIEMAKGDGSETAAGIAGDMMDMGEPKEKPESLGAALVSDEQEVTATVERRVMDFNTFVNESYNRSVNEANGSSDYQFNVYSDWSDDANTSTKLTVYAVPSNIAEDAIKKNRWDSEDYNGMDEKKFKSLNWKKYAIKEFGLNDIEATWSITPWDKAFKKKTGSYADNIIELELE